MKNRHAFFVVFVSLASLASCAREDGESSNEIMAEMATPAAPLEQPAHYDAQQARLDWMARPDTPSDSFGTGGGE